MQKCPQSGRRRPVPPWQLWVCLWNIPVLRVGPAWRHEAPVRAPPCVPAATNITSTTGLKLPKSPTDVPTHEGPSGWCCSQQQERWLDTGCARSGGTHGCDGQLGHSLAEDKSHSSHFATGTELRQDAALGPSFPCTDRGTPTMWSSIPDMGWTAR